MHEVMPDWALAQEHLPAIRRAAMRSGRMFDFAIPPRDLVQEGLIYVALHVEAMHSALERDPEQGVESAVLSEMKRLCRKEKDRQCEPLEWIDE